MRVRSPYTTPKMRTSEDGTEIKREFYKSYLILVRNLYKQSEPEKDTPNISDIRKRFLVGSILFLAFAMESFINDFGDTFVPEYKDLEKIETINKFVLFPRLSPYGKVIVIKGENHYKQLKMLFNYRNYLAHYKPAFRTKDTKEEKNFQELNHTLVASIYRDMITLLKLINKKSNMFEGENDWISEYSDDINSST